MKKTLLLSFALALFISSFLVPFSSASAQACDPSANWCPPTVSPPGVDSFVGIPINTGPNGQTKAGDLTIGPGKLWVTGGGIFTSGLLLSGGGLDVTTSATSSFSGGKGINLTGGCFAINDVCIAGGSGSSGGGSFWSQTGTSPNFNLFPTALTTKVGIGTATPNNLFQVKDLINFDNSNYNTAIGYQALFSNIVGSNNTAVGSAALYTNTGSDNVAIGSDSLSANVNGYKNTATGVNALTANTSGGDNVATGYNALQANTSGEKNTAIGSGALYANTTGHENTAVGLGALQSNIGGSRNTAVGRYALMSSSVIDGNTALGYGAGYGDVTTPILNQHSYLDTYALFLGYQASRDPSIPFNNILTNITAIGKNARVGQINSIVLGGTGDDAVSVGIGTAKPAATLHVVGSARITSLSGTAGKVVCVKSSGDLGVCSTAPDNNGVCTCG